LCGFAGIVDLCGEREPDRGAVRRMTDALVHRGPDEDGWFFAKGIGIGHRRLQIIGLADGRQPIFNEDRTVGVIYNGELFDYREQRALLAAKGHVLRTHTDTEIIPHLYEEYGEGMFEHLKGQFAFALVDLKTRTLFLARDRVGICPLHWSRQRDQLFFGSEISALLASGLVPAVCDPKGLDHVLSFMGMGARRTMFAGVQSVLPGHYLKIELGSRGRSGDIVERRYWDLDFPDEGDEDDPENPKSLIDEFDATFHRAVELRLRADIPVVGYLSGGVDSASVMAAAARVRGSAVPSFTIRIPTPDLDETSNALAAGRAIGTTPTIVDCDADLIRDIYPKLVSAASSPVVDTSCAALWCLSREVHKQGYKVALTGEGADEGLGGYPWFKFDALRRLLNFGGANLGDAAIRAVRHVVPAHRTSGQLARFDSMLGGLNAYSAFHGLVSSGARQFYSADLKHQLGSFVPQEDYAFDIERIRRWHPLNRMLYANYKVHLGGLLLNHKGDRVAMANSIETRYPFLDEDVIRLLARIHPKWKLRGINKDKYLLRQMAARYLPPEIASRPKHMFRAPFAASIFKDPPAYVRELMSPRALRKNGYFDVDKVRSVYEICEKGEEGKTPRFATQLGLVGVLATQLWHRIHIDKELVEPAEAIQKAKLTRPATGRPGLSAGTLAGGGMS
jgi:asparagine synthase (glutamine-hydrolysing)